MLIGDPGVGKTAIVEGLAQWIVNNEVPDTLADKRILALDLSGMVAGTQYRGEFEERLKKVLQEVRENPDDQIIFLDELHTVVGAGAVEAPWMPPTCSSPPWHTVRYVSWAQPR